MKHTTFCFRVILFLAATFLLMSAEHAFAAPFWAQVTGVNQTGQNLDWEEVSWDAASRPAVATTTSPFDAPFIGSLLNTINVFYRDGGGCIKHYRGTDQNSDLAWQNKEKIGDCGTALDGPLAALARRDGGGDLFWFSGAPGKPAKLMHMWTGDFKIWQSEVLWTTATAPASPPTVASWGPGRIDLFWRDSANQLRWYGCDNGSKGKAGFNSQGWFDKERVVWSNVTGDPTVAERTTNVVNLFWRDESTGQLQQVNGNGSGSWYAAYPSIGVVKLSSAPSATSWGPDRVDVVYAVDQTHLGHLWYDGRKGDWTPHTETLFSSWQVGAPVVTAGPSKKNRLDVYSLPVGGGLLAHTLYQESLEGFIGIGEGPGEGDWCWASAAISVVDYMKYLQTGVNPQIQSCTAADKYPGLPNSCCAKNTPEACLVGGTVEPILTTYGVKYSSSGPLALSDLEFYLWSDSHPVISNHQHSDGTGHYVVLVDVYHFRGTDMVVIYGTQFNAYWVLPYPEYIKNHGSWWVAGMDAPI
jgi:hypothetical protein